MYAVILSVIIASGRRAAEDEKERFYVSMSIPDHHACKRKRRAIQSALESRASQHVDLFSASSNFNKYFLRKQRYLISMRMLSYQKALHSSPRNRRMITQTSSSGASSIAHPSRCRVLPTLDLQCQWEERKKRFEKLSCSNWQV
jgi:hypothetical protein